MSTTRSAAKNTWARKGRRRKIRKRRSGSIGSSPSGQGAHRPAESMENRWGKSHGNMEQVMTIRVHFSTASSNACSSGPVPTAPPRPPPPRSSQCLCASTPASRGPRLPDNAGSPSVPGGSRRSGRGARSQSAYPGTEVFSPSFLQQNLDFQSQLFIAFQTRKVVCGVSKEEGAVVRELRVHFNRPNVEMPILLFDEPT